MCMFSQRRSLLVLTSTLRIWRFLWLLFMWRCWLWDRNKKRIRQTRWDYQQVCLLGIESLLLWSYQSTMGWIETDQKPQAWYDTPARPRIEWQIGQRYSWQGQLPNCLCPGSKNVHDCYHHRGNRHIMSSMYPKRLNWGYSWAASFLADLTPNQAQRQTR